jgi:hypothetical protein
MHPDVPDPRLGCRQLDDPQDIARLDRRPELGREHQARVYPLLTSMQPLRSLTRLRGEDLVAVQTWQTWMPSPPAEWTVPVAPDHPGYHADPRFTFG